MAKAHLVSAAIKQADKRWEADVGWKGKKNRWVGGRKRESETIVTHQPDQPLFTVEKGENWEFCHTVLMSGSNSAKRSLVLS